MTSTTEITTVSITTESPIPEIEAKNDYVDTIQTVIASMDADSTAVVNQTEDTWKFNYGSVEVIVNITGQEPSDTFTVLSTVLSFPVKDEAKLLRLLLEKNASETFEARFAIQNDKVIVVAARSVEDLSPGEISRIITIVAAIADDNDEELQKQFGIA